jgi:hypothetical protein
MTDIIIGLVLLVIGVAIWWGYTHQKPVAVASPKDIVSTISASLSTSWDELKKDLPGLISTEVATLRSSLADMEQRALAAEASLVKEQQARQAALGAVATAGAALDNVRAQPGFTPSPGAT